MPTEQDVKFSDFIRGLPAASESDLSAGNNMPIVSASEVKKMGGENVAKAGDVTKNKVNVSSSGVDWKLSSYPYAYTGSDYKIAPKDSIQVTEKKFVGVRIYCSIGAVISFGKFTKGATLADNVYSSEIKRFAAQSRENIVPIDFTLGQNQGLWFQVISGNVSYSENPNVDGSGFYNLKISTNESKENTTALMQFELIADYSVLGAYLKKTYINKIIDEDDFLLNSYSNNLLAGYYWANKTSVVDKAVGIRAVKIKATAGASAVVSYGVFTLTSSPAVTDFSPIIGSANVSANSSGEAVVSFDQPIQLNAGQAIYLVGSTFLKYSATNLGGCYYIKADGTSTEVKNNPGVEVGVAYVYALEGYATEKEIESIKQEIQNKEEKQNRVSLVNKTYVSDLTDVSMNNWSVDSANKCFVNSAYNIGSPFKVNKFFAIDKRRLSIEFSLNGDAEVFFGFSTNLSAYNEASFVSIDFVNGKIKIFEQTSTNISSADSLVLAAEKNFTKSSVSTDKYLVEFERGENWSSTISIYNMTRQKALLGQLVYNEFRTGRPYPKQGFMYGFPILFTRLATINLYRLNVSAPCFDTNRLYIIGDSITEGFGSYTSQNTWSRKVCSAVGKSVVSAKSGGTLDVLVQTIVSEIPKIKPGRVLIAFGHNDVWNISDYTNFRNKLNTCISSLSNMGIEVVLACMPRTTDAAVDSAAANAVIADVANENGLPLVRFDVATSTDYDLSKSWDGSLFFDAAHPNEQGYQKMFVQFTADCSECVMNND